jgi:hypothetical protein
VLDILEIYFWRKLALFTLLVPLSCAHYQGKERKSLKRLMDTDTPTVCPHLREIATRLDAVEAAILSATHQVLTERLVVGTELLGPGLVAEIHGGAIELRLIAGGHIAASAILHAGAPNEEFTLGETVGLQIWGDGHSLCEIAAWPQEGRWHSHLVIE